MEKRWNFALVSTKSLPVSISFSLIDWNNLHLRSRYSRFAWKSWDFVSSLIWCSSDSSDDEEEDPDSDEELELEEDEDEPDEEVDDVLKLCMATLKENRIDKSTDKWKQSRTSSLSLRCPLAILDFLFSQSDADLTCKKVVFVTQF